MADFRVRRLTESERLGDLQVMAHSAFKEFTPPSGVFDETFDDFAAHLHDEIILVAEAGADFVGSVFCARKDNSLYLTRLAVLPAWRRRGIGAALVRAAKRETRRLNLPVLTLRVRKTLSENRRYFERLGFAVTGEVQDPGRTPYYAIQSVLS